MTLDNGLDLMFLSSDAKCTRSLAKRSEMSQYQNSTVSSKGDDLGYPSSLERTLGLPPQCSMTRVLREGNFDGFTSGQSEWGLMQRC